MVTQTEAIIKAFKELEGCRHHTEIAAWVSARSDIFGRKWVDFSTCMTDMVPVSRGGNRSSTKKDSDRVLERCGSGAYRLITNKKKQKIKQKTTQEPRVSKEKIYEYSDIEFWVPGDPATFATQGEKPWKDSLKKGIPEKETYSKEKGVIIDFYLKNLFPNNQPLDLDNLCDPLFSVLVNNKKWFWGGRPNIRWWLASKNQSSDSGCRISLFSALHSTTIKNVIFKGYYEGILPTRGSDPDIPKWLEKVSSNPVSVNGLDLFVSLKFHQKDINIGEIATGPVKAIIDCLYPIIGGTVSRPEDWKIQKLFVEKNVGSGKGVEIIIAIL